MTTSTSVTRDHAEPDAAYWHDQAAAARLVARNAYRDTARLIRVLTVINEPLPITELLERSLETLSEVFSAAVVAVLHVVDDRVHVRAACGLAEDAQFPGSSWTLPSGERARDHAGRPGTAILGPASPATAGPVAALSPRSVAWAPMGTAGSDLVLLVLYRVGTDDFTDGEVQSLASIARQLQGCLQAGEQRAALADSEGRLRLITDSISDMITVVDEQGILRYASPSLTRELALTPAEVIGQPAEELVHPDHRQRFRAMLAAVHTAPIVEFLVCNGRGGWTWVETACRPSEPATGGAAHRVLSSRVVDERKRLEDQLLHRASHDSLTGLANRDLVRKALTAALTSAPDAGPVGVLFCDLDHFKAVNDRHGHPAGDELIRQVAARLRACLRDGDLLGRLGGDEFVVILREAPDLDAVENTGRRLVDALGASFLVQGEQTAVSVSVGGVLGQPGRTTVEDLLRDADAAMYDAKDAGRGRVVIFDEAAAQRSLHRLVLRSDLDHAVARGELELHYQPIVDLATGKLVAFEALLRWRHPRLGFISPAQFIPLAEASGAILSIGHWALQQAAAQLADWHTLRPELWMSVNLSVVELNNPALVDQTLAAARAAGIDPAALCLEITEDRNLSTTAADQIRRLHAAGFRIALDDFGTLQSNFDRLRQFPVDHIKIDQSFVANLESDLIDQAAVSAAIAIGHALGASVVAEGLETTGQRNALTAAGCRLAQGWLYSPALSADEAQTLLVQPCAAPSLQR